MEKPNVAHSEPGLIWELNDVNSIPFLKIILRNLLWVAVGFELMALGLLGKYSTA
jgi:hypothetical protein